MGGMPEHEPFHSRLKRLREERGLSQPALFRAVDGVSFSTIVSLEQDPTRATNGARGRARYPSPETIEALAPALGVQPEEFPEYRLAMARRLLDERAVGLERALETLGLLEALSAPSAAEPLRPEDIGLDDIPSDTGARARGRRRRAS